MSEAFFQQKPPRLCGAMVPVMVLKQWKRIPANKNPLRADVNQSVCCWRALCHAGARPWMESDGRARFFTALGKMPRCLQLSRPHGFFFFFFDKLVVRLLRLMHISQKSFLPSFLCDLPVGHDKPPSTHRSIKPNISRTMQIMTNSIILHYALSC